MIDSFGRKINYLRLSLTDRCNLRCVYCLPKFFNRFTPADNLLTDDEIIRLLSCFAEVGISKIRLTGGEPLLRPYLPQLINRMSQIHGIKDIALSTNGVRLKAMAADLARAGLKRVNISLDSLNPEKFSEITRFGTLDLVLEGIEAALAQGLNPVKINVVVARGMNHQEIDDFVKLTEQKPVHVRFIELMPMGETGFFTKERWVPEKEILESAAPVESLPQDDWPKGSGPSRYYKRPGAKGTVGIISALSCGFCSTCNRMRLSAKGMLYPCLDGAWGTNLLELIRSGAETDEIIQAIRKTIDEKPEKHQMVERMAEQTENPRFMCQVGG